MSVAGGIKIEDTGADLAVLAAMWSSYKGKPLMKTFYSADVSLGSGKKTKQPVYVGEVSLLGEVKKVRGWEKRKKEAESMGRRMVEIKNIREIK